MAGRAAVRQVSRAPPHGSALHPLRRPLPRDSVSKFAKEEIAPKVLDMDREAKIYPEVLTGLFEQGVRAEVKTAQAA